MHPQNLMQKSTAYMLRQQTEQGLQATDELQLQQVDIIFQGEHVDGVQGLGQGEFEGRRKRKRGDRGLPTIQQIEQTATQLKIDEKILAHPESPAPTLHANPKKYKLLISTLTLAAVTAIIFYLSFSLIPSGTGMIQNSSTFSSSTILLNRHYTENKVYYYQHLISTVQNDNLLKINYTLLMAVQRIEFNGTIFAAVLQKRSQKIYDQNNGSLINQVYYDESNSFYDLLKTGVGSVRDTMQVQQQQINITNALNAQNISSSGNNSDIITVPIVLQVFQIEVAHSGKISKFTFPKQMQKSTLGLLRCFAKMFSPVLTKQNYLDSKPIAQVVIGPSYHKNTGRLLQMDPNNTDINSTNANDTVPSIYSQQHVYSYYSDDTSIVLTKISSVNSSDVGQNTVDTSNQTNVFNLSGVLTWSRIESKTLFLPREQVPPENANFYNIDVNQSSHQICEMKLVDSYIADGANVGIFGGFLDRYRNRSQTYTFTIEKMIQHMTNKNQGEQQQPGSTRLLLSLTGIQIIKYQNQITTLSTNLLGISIGSHAYIKLRLSFTYDSGSLLRIKPKFQTEMGEVYRFAWISQPVKIIEHTHEQQPLSLSFTLKTIEEVMALKQGQFVSKVVALWNVILNNQFQDNLAPKINGLLIDIDNIMTKMSQREQSLAPTQVINKVYASVAIIKAIINSKGANLLAPQNQFANLLYNELTAYHQDAFSQALAVFERVKGDLARIRDQGKTFMEVTQREFVQIEIVEIKQKIYTLVPEDVYEDYRRQMEKATPIIEYLQFARQNGLNYAERIQNTLAQHERNFLSTTKHTVDLYFRNQTNITNTYVDLIGQRQDTVLGEYDQFWNMKERVGIAGIQQKALNFFKGFFNFDLSIRRFETQWYQIAPSLTNYAIEIDTTRADCCQWRYRKKILFFWGGQRYCAIANQATEGLVTERYKVDRITGNGVMVSNLAQEIAKQLGQFSKLIDDPTKTVVEKYFELKMYFSSFQSITNQTRFQQISTTLQKSLDEIIALRRSMNCGPYTAVENYMSTVRDWLIPIIAEFAATTLATVQQYDKIIKEFDPDTYTAIIQNTVIIQQLPKFVRDYISAEEQTRGIVYSLFGLTQVYDVKKFADSNATALEVYQFYENITASLDILCQTKQINVTTIEGPIRGQYKFKRDRVKDLTSNVFAQQLEYLKIFLNYGTDEIMKTFQGMKFCEEKSQFWSDVQILFPDWKNFTLIYDLYDQLIQVTANTNTMLAPIKADLHTVQQRFFKQFTRQGYESLIFATESLAEQLIGINSNTSVQLSNIRTMTNILTMFLSAPQNQLMTGINIFLDTPYTLDSVTMFPQIKEKVVNSLDIIEMLSFDTIALVVAAVQVKQYFDGTMSNFTTGADNVRGIFVGLCQEFIDLNSSVTQANLNRINGQFREIMSKFHTAIFSHIAEQNKYIVDRFNNYKFTSDYLHQLFINAMDRQQFYFLQISTKQQYMYNNMQILVKQAITFIQNLEIASLNSILELASVIKSEFQRFLGEFPGLVQQMDGFKTLVDGDFRQLFMFKEFYRGKQVKIEDSYGNFSGKVNEKWAETEKSLSENRRFLQKLKNTTLYFNINRLKVEFFIDFAAFWSETSKQQEKIENLLLQINPSSAQNLKDLSRGKKALEKIRGQVQFKVNSINSNYQQIRKKLFAIRSLNFVDCLRDISKNVAFSLRAIQKDLYSLVELDFVPVRILSTDSSLLQTPEIAVAFTTATTDYASLVIQQTQFSQLTDSVFAQMNAFTRDPLAIAFQQLNAGSLFIRSLTGQPVPPQTKQLFNYGTPDMQIPVFWYTQAIPTPVGPFFVKFQIDFRYGASAYMTLTDYRSIKISANFYVALTLQVSFFYGIPLLLQIGVYIRGTILKAQVRPEFQIVNFIPVQLVQVARGVRQVDQNNNGQISYVVSLEMKAAIIRVGFYAKFIWLEIIWLDIGFCIFGFCIKFKLPIGFKLAYKLAEWGWETEGVTLLKMDVVPKHVVKQWKF